MNAVNEVKAALRTLLNELQDRSLGAAELAATIRIVEALREVLPTFTAEAMPTFDDALLPARERLEGLQAL